MKFKIALTERAPEVPLLIWNDIQKKLWLNLVNIGLVKRNDTNVLLKFGEFFDNFYKIKHKIPNIKDVIKWLK